MVSLTVENYVKAVYQICAETNATTASTGEIARRLSVSPGSVTSMLRTLSESGLVDYQAYEGVRLTESGSRLALRVLRRHRLIELFLVQTLGFAWDEVHQEAEHLEHAVSDRLVDRIDDFLDRPQFDPHGDPIPDAEGAILDRTTLPLDACGAGTKFRLARVLDQSPDFLRFLSQSGLAIGQEAAVAENHPSAGALVLSINETVVPLGRSEANKILVECLSSGNAKRSRQR